MNEQITAFKVRYQRDDNRFVSSKKSIFNSNGISLNKPKTA